MESLKTDDPKEKITNQDEAVTNKDEDMDKGEQPINQSEPEMERVPTVIPDDDSGKPPAGEDPSSKDNGPSGENL